MTFNNNNILNKSSYLSTVECVAKGCLKPKGGQYQPTILVTTVLS